MAIRSSTQRTKEKGVFEEDAGNVVAATKATMLSANRGIVVNLTIFELAGGLMLGWDIVVNEVNLNGLVHSSSSEDYLGGTYRLMPIPF